MEDKLLFSLCHAHNLKEKPEQFSEGVFDKIFFIARFSNFTESELRDYEAAMKEVDVYNATIAYAKKEGA
ncbi:MAG: Rpn family recombination-promoting nuclease/putative transposase, partial [Fibromonadaceae bacterium]|nr:Rpn family recombination-promoting nuclease/putative transposase [Fibromonadaceae bacterium]